MGFLFVPSLDLSVKNKSMRTFLSIIFLGGLYLVFLISESLTRKGLDSYFNQDYVYENLTKLLPYLIAYLSVLWIALIAYVAWLVYNKEEDNSKFVAWIIIVGFVAIPLTIFVSPFFRVLF